MLPAFGNAADLADLDRRLAGSPDDVELLYARACVLDLLGRNNDARDAYIEVIKRSPTHLGALGNLGTMLYNAGFRSAARLTYAQALSYHPSDVTTLVNYGNALLDTDDFEGAAAVYQRALAVEPDAGAAHQGLSHALSRLGRDEEAERHRRAGFTLAPIAVRAFRGEGVPISLLVLSSALRGNVATEAAFDDRTFLLVTLFAEHYDPLLPLPPHDVIVNAIGDADLCAQALDAAQALVRDAQAPIVNAPAAVRKTGRAAVAAALRDVDGLIVPEIREYDRADASRMTHFPVLLRAPGYHTGEHFEVVRSREELGPVLNALPGERVLAIQPLDARGADGAYRKYRVLSVGGRFYPVHLARSSQWKVHYFSADLVRTPEAIAEEEAFLRDMRTAIGERAVRALEAIRERLALEYFGVDFAVDASGNVLLFEANAAMRAIVPPADGSNEPRRRAALEANAAFRDLVLGAAGRR
ncbi:MAG TPA: tetratricopeptide repeat protein [Candidatus Aquilonibacter sp.]